MIDMKKVIFSSCLSATMLLAGGKGMIPSESPVEPIEIIQASPYYVGIGFVMGRYDGCVFPGCEYEDVTYGVIGKLGYEWNQYIGMEARVLGTFWGADPLGGQKLEYGGLFAKPMYPLGESFNIYGLLGYGWTKTITGGNGNLQTIDEGGFSAGFGLEYDLFSKEDTWGIFVDYHRLLIKSNAPEIDAISIGVTYDF